MASRKRARSKSCAIDCLAPKRNCTYIVRCPYPQPTEPTTVAPAATRVPVPTIPSLPLTYENLYRLQNTITGSVNRSHTPSSSRTRSNLDTWEKLAAFKVHVDTGHQLPNDLEAHIKEVIQKARDVTVEASPNARKITQKRRLAAQQNERTGIKHIEPYMLFRGVADLDERVNPVPHIASKDEVFLNKYFRPRPPTEGVKSTFGELSQPRPDSCIGYVTRRDAQAAASQAPFSIDEEQTLQAFPLTQFLHFPFLTSQWKAQIANENMLHARYQAARDGAVVVNYLWEFFNNSDIEPSIVTTCHFSLTCDLETAEVWVHWRNDEQHHMELINKSSLRQLSEVEGTRNVLRNIVEYSLGERLNEIKKAIPTFATRCAQGRVPEISEADCRTTSTPSVLPLSKFQFTFPMTPSSLGSSSVTGAQSDIFEPTKKRRLNDSTNASDG